MKRKGRKEGGMKPGDRRKDKVQHHTSLYRSVSSPGIVSSYEKDTEKREEVVVGGYGLPPMHSPSPDGISSSSPAMAINHPGYQQQERGLMGVTTTTTIAGGGSKGRKRPSRKTRQAVDGYGSSPDAHGTSPPYRNGSYLSLSLSLSLSPLLPFGLFTLPGCIHPCSLLNCLVSFFIYISYSLILPRQGLHTHAVISEERDLRRLTLKGIGLRWEPAVLGRHERMSPDSSL